MNANAAKVVCKMPRHRSATHAKPQSLIRANATMAINPWKVFSIGIVLIGVLVGAWQTLDNYSEMRYDEGYTDGARETTERTSRFIYNNLRANGYVPFNAGNTTIRLVAQRP